MDRRRGQSNRPASSEEVDCWARTTASLANLASIYSDSTTAETVGRVNRFFTTWPTDDIVPSQGLEHLKQNYTRLSSGLDALVKASEKEVKAVDNALEQLEILIALRKAPEMQAPDKRNKRPRAPSPSSGIATPTAVQSQPNPSRGVSITLPARNNGASLNNAPFSREPKARREALAKQLPLKEGRKVAFHPHSAKTNGAVDSEQNWILASITKCINADKNRYEVQDDDDKTLFNTTLRSIIPLPDPSAPPNSAAHPSAYPDFSTGASVMALYPDTTSFYRAVVLKTPQENEQTGAVPCYLVQFEDDDNLSHNVPKQRVVEWPGF